MAAAIASGSPQEAALQNAVQAKLIESGLISADDSGLSEYIVLMVVNGNQQQEILNELSTDILDVGPEDQRVSEFVQWLFDQINALQQQDSSGGNVSVNDPQRQVEQHVQSQSMQTNGVDNQSTQPLQDAEMGDAAPSQTDGSM